MFPTLIEFGGTRVPTYLVALLTGFCLALWLGWRDAKNLGFKRQEYLDFGIWLLIFGIAGARLFHVLFDGLGQDYLALCLNPFELDGFSLPEGLCSTNLECIRGGGGPVCNPLDGLCYPARDCFRVFKFWSGGLVVYGGVIAAGLFAWWYARRSEINWQGVLDLGAWGIPLGIGFGRLGCFAAGCCYGKLCDLGLAVHFPVNSPAYRNHWERFQDALQAQWQSGIEGSLGVWPTQLMESFGAFAIFLFAYFWLRPRTLDQRLPKGSAFGISIALYAALRFVLEFLRADERGEFLSLSTSQWISLVAIGLALWMYKRVQKSAIS